MSAAPTVQAGESARAAAWEAYFTTSAQLRDAIDRELRRRAGLNLSEYNVLLQLSRAPGGSARPGNLAREVVFSPSRLTYTVGRLAGRGLVGRRPIARDKRGGEVVLTPAGARAFERASVWHRRIVRDLFLDHLQPDDSRVLARVFGDLRDRLRATR